MNTQSIQSRIEELQDIINYCSLPIVIKSKLVLEMGSLQYQLINA